VGPGGGIEEGSLDQEVVCFRVSLRLSKSNIGKESPVPAAHVVTFGSSHSSIFHMLGPSGVPHVDMPAPLSKVWNHALKLSIGSHEVQCLLLSVQVIGTVGIQVHIEVAHKDWSMSIGGMLIKGGLDMDM